LQQQQCCSLQQQQQKRSLVLDPNLPRGKEQQAFITIAHTIAAM
jgi:hypothetical protein